VRIIAVISHVMAVTPGINPMRSVSRACCTGHGRLLPRPYNPLAHVPEKCGGEGAGGEKAGSATGSGDTLATTIAQPLRKQWKKIWHLSIQVSIHLHT
jgi:Na+-transporting NADH:ubiquinone oxidoreductase subunit NqrF